MLCNHKTNTPILKNRRKSLIALDSGGLRGTLVRLWRLQACQRPSENCKRGRPCSSTIDASPQASTAPCVLALAILWTWPRSEHLSTRIPSDRERSNSEHLAALCATRERSHSVERWWNPRVFFPMRGVLGLAEHLTADWHSGPHRRQWLHDSRARGLQHRMHPIVCVIGPFTLLRIGLQFQFPVPSSQFPAMSICHGLGEWVR